jgi:hypothetical protein
MLRILVVLLILANAGFYSWRQGWLDNVVGVRAMGDREPARLAQQVSPEAVRVLPPLPADPASSTAPAGDTSSSTGEAGTANTCVEIGPFTTAQLSPAEAALQTVMPPSAWTDVKGEVPAVWIVFMGPYADREARQKKTDELKRLRVGYEEVRNIPDFGDGLALGRFEDRAAAEKAATELVARGVRTGRVAQLSPASVTHTLRVAQADVGLQGRLLALQSGGLQGRSFAPCKP